jgi:DNA-directed RNA polymerase specialized sigma24 family protein
MKITDDVITKFFGNGKGFVMTSIKRWGGFIKEEDELDHAQFNAIKSAVSAKDREVEFENELHMVNYLMKICYWGWCDAVKKRLRNPTVILESQLIPAWADDDYVQTNKLEESVDPKDLVLEPHRLHAIAQQFVLDKLGPFSASIFELHYIREFVIKDIAKELEVSTESVRSRLNTINRLLLRRLKHIAHKEYQIGRRHCS